MLIERKKCPNGCENSTLNESVKYINNPNSNLLLETASSVGSKIKVKSYTCSCCGVVFEIQEQPQGNVMYS